MRTTKLNIFDYVILTILILVALIFAVGNLRQGDAPQKAVTLVVEAPIDEAVYTEALKEKEVYVNSVNKPVRVEKVSRVGETMQVLLSAPGKKEGNVYTFNGQRVLIGQKAEIHGGYFLQGKVITFYE